MSSYATVSKSLAAAGAFVVSLDSAVNIAFPAMASAFGVPADRMRWVIISYVLTYAVLAFVGGALGDRVGHGRVFLTGLALGAIAYAVCGTAPTFGVLLAGRVLQGVAGGLIYGTAPALVTLAVEPAGRGRALGFLNASMGVALAVGPLVAGLLVERFGWPAVFHLRLPLVIVVLAWAAVRLPPGGVRTSPPRVAFSDVTRGAVLGPGALAFLANAGVFAIWLLVPFYLIARRGFGPVIGGVLFTLTPLGTALAASLAGRLADRVGFRGPMIAGLGLEAAGLLLLSGAGLTTPPAVLALGLFGAGFGLGVFQVPNMMAVMAGFGPRQQGAAGGFAFLARTLGTVGGVAALAEVFATRRDVVGFDAAFSAAFLLAAAFVAGGALLATRRWRDRSA